MAGQVFGLLADEVALSGFQVCDDDEVVFGTAFEPRDFFSRGGRWRSVQYTETNVSAVGTLAARLYWTETIFLLSAHSRRWTKPMVPPQQRLV